MNINWNINNLERKITNGYVTTIHWSVSANEKNNYANNYGTVTFKDGEPIIPFENLTKEIILDWLFKNINKEEIENNLKKELQSFNNSEVTNGLPFELAPKFITENN